MYHLKHTPISVYHFTWDFYKSHSMVLKRLCCSIVSLCTAVPKEREPVKTCRFFATTVPYFLTLAIKFYFMSPEAAKYLFESHI